jgi:hypothetical protein
MGIDTSGLAFPKGALRVEVKREKRLTNEERERDCKREVTRLYGRKCCVPGCKEMGLDDHHVIHRSQSKRLKYLPENRRPICRAHHDLEHGGKIQIATNKDGELIITGEKKYLQFKL